MRNYIVILLITVIGGAGSYLSNILLAGVLDIVEYANYASAYAIMAFVVSITSIGLPLYLLREVNFKRHKESIYVDGIFTSLMLQVLVYIGLCSAYSSNSMLYGLIPYGLGLIFTSNIESLYQSRGSYLKMSMGQFSSNTCKITYALLLLVIPFADFGLSPTTVIFIVNLLFLLVAFFWLASIFKVQVLKPSLLKKGTVYCALPFFISDVSHFVYYQSDILVLTLYGFTEEVANYSLAVVFMTAALIVSTTLYQKYIATIFYARYRLSKFSGCQLLIKHALGMAGLSFLGLLIYYFWGEKIISFIVSSKYTLLYDYMDILIVSVVVRYIYSPLALFFDIENFPALKSKVFMGAALVNIVLNLCFVPWYGAFAAAWATLFCESLIFSCLVLFFIKFRTRQEQSNQDDNLLGDTREALL